MARGIIGRQFTPRLMSTVRARQARSCAYTEYKGVDLIRLAPNTSRASSRGLRGAAGDTEYGSYPVADQGGSPAALAAGVRRRGIAIEGTNCGSVTTVGS